MIIDSIKVNFLDKFYLFYDWLLDDDIEIINNIPIYKVSDVMIEDIINYQIIIADLCIIKDNKQILFTDDFSFIVIEFDSEGKSIYKSSITLEDEIKISRIIVNLKKQIIPYTKFIKEEKSEELRINELARKVIKVELSNLIISNNNDKIAYLYYLWFKKMGKCKKQMLSCMQKKLQLPMTDEELKIYRIIKNHYKYV